MDHRVINKTFVIEKMFLKPRGQRVFDAFNGNWELLTVAELLDIKDIIKNETNKVLEELEKQILYLDSKEVK